MSRLFFLGRRWFKDTINRQERAEGNWLITSQGMNWGHQQWYWVPGLKGGTLAPVECFARAWHRQKSWCESLSETASISEIKTQTPAGSQNTLSWKQGNSRRVSGHHIHFLYLFPSVVISEHEMLFKQTLVFNTYGYFSISPAIPSYYYLQLLAVSNSRSQGCVKCHPLPWRGVQEKGQFVCLRLRGKALHPSKQTKWVFISAKEGARRYLLDDLKAMYLGHLLTNKETHLIWSAVQSSMHCWAERIPLWAATSHLCCPRCCLKYLVWCFTWCFCSRSFISISRSS